MYLHGSAVTSLIKIFLASIGLYGSISSGSPEAIGKYILVVIETVMPLFITVDGGIVSWIDAVVTFIFNLAFGIGWSTIKYDMATR